MIRGVREISGVCEREGWDGKKVYLNLSKFADVRVTVLLCSYGMCVKWYQ